MNNLYSILIMSNFDPGKNKDFENHIIIDYPRVTLNKNEAVVPTASTKGFSISYHNSSSENNFFYTEKVTQSNYMHTKMYVHELIHYNITGVTTDNDNIVGELIIEHTTSSTQEKLYTCYLLETKSLLITDETEIDKMLAITDSQSTTLDFELNAIIPKQESCIVYADNGNKICVFTTPIQINTASKQKIEDNANFGNVTTMFGNYPSEGESYIVIPSNNISKRDSEEIYIDCSPTGASEEEQNTYNIPINSKMATESQESDMMKTTVNFGIFILAMIVSYITVPLLYKNLIIDGSSIAFSIDEKKRFTRIRAADILISLGMFMAVSSLVSAGGAKDDYQLISIGIFTFVFSILSYGLIQLKKMEPAFMTTKVEGQNITSDPVSDTALRIEAFPFDDLWPTISVVIGIFLSEDNFSAFVGAFIIGLNIFFALLMFGAIELESIRWGTFTGIVTGTFVVISIIIALKTKFKAQLGNV